VTVWDEFMAMRLAGFLLIIVLLSGFAPSRQDQSNQIALLVTAGFDGGFRENQWMPIYINVTNNGSDVEGELVVRPETSNGSVTNRYSMPISLPQSSRKTAFLYVTAESFASEVRVELIDTDGTVRAVTPANLRSLLPRDQLHVVISQSPAGSIDLTGIHDSGYVGFQANWRVENIPDQAAALESVNTIAFSDVDTGTLTSPQQRAIADWVGQGGHLIITGGQNWRETAAGLMTVLPLIPDGSVTANNLTPIADWLRLTGDDLSHQSILATGALHAEAFPLVKDTEEHVLLARRTFGAGTVDYLAADPNSLPLRGWGGLTELWLTLATTLGARPSWSYGFQDWERANSAANILPGVDVLPDVLPLCGFLGVYIGLIGPLNYVVLNRINRREWAWVTIPSFVILFSVLAWILGFNLRGNEVTLSRISVVQSWQAAERAKKDTLISLLSPRRAQYTLSTTEAGFLSPIPSISAQQGSLFAGSAPTSTHIQQGEVFRAVEFPIDSSYIAAFHSRTTHPKPAVSGRASLAYDPVNRTQIFRGSVSNNTDFTIYNPVILVRGQALDLKEPLQPGSIEPFEIMVSGQGLPSPTPLAYANTSFSPFSRRLFGFSSSSAHQTVNDILDDELTKQVEQYSRGGDPTPEEQEALRRMFFLSSFVEDAYGFLTGRGNQVYFAGWTTSPVQEITLEGANWKPLDTTLYLVQLDVEVASTDDTVVISADQFTWFTQNRTTLVDLAPIELDLQQIGDEVTFRFTPLPEAVLREVDELTLFIDRNETTTRTVPLQLWNYEKGGWDDVTIESSNQIALRTPQSYLGAQNTVQVRITADSMGGYPFIRELTVEQKGRF
jgi:hypothetical protein